MQKSGVYNKAEIILLTIWLSQDVLNDHHHALHFPHSSHLLVYCRKTHVCGHACKENQPFFLDKQIAQMSLYTFKTDVLKQS